MLPKIIHPLFDVEVPSTKQHLKLRPMLQKDEKILLTAKEGDDPSEILNAIRQVVNNCVITSDFDIDALTIFDLEYAFIRLRSISVSNTTKVSYKDNEDEEIRDFEINLDKVNILFPESTDNKVVINEAVHLTLKNPSCKMYSDKEFLHSRGEEAVSRLVGSAIDKVYDGHIIHEAKTLSPEELKAFLDEMPIPAYSKLRDFVFNSPHLNYEIKYTNNKGNEKKIVLNTLNDFFTLA